MTIPTSSELAALRSRPHSAEMWLSIYKPATVLAAQVTGSWGQGVNSIPYDSVVTGSFANVVGGMTMLIGTYPYGRDVGKIRVRSATAAAITVAENSHINWLDNLYLTVIDFHEPWPVFPRMTLADGNTTWYKDYDIPYSNQNSVLGSLINMGPHHAGFVGTGTAGVYYSASGTVNMLGSSLMYGWEFPGGSPSWASGSAPGYISYPTAGFFTTKLTVTAANGVVERGYRHISIYDRPQSGNHPPILKWGLMSFDGSRSDGGWSARIWAREDLSSIVDGALCVLFVESDYAGVPLSIGGNALNRGSILFVGYINGETIHYDWEKSYVEFDVLSISGIMKELECFSVALNSSPNPAYWYEMLDMDVRRAIYHYLRWHTTVLDITDVEFRNFTDQKIQYFDADKMSLYDAVNGIAQSALIGQAVSDRQGKIWFEQEAGIIPNASGTVAQSMDLTRQDWIGEPYFSYQDHDNLSYVEMGGIAYSGVITGTMKALLAGAPGAYVPRYGGSEQNVSGLALVDQEQLNALAGDFLSWRGSRYSDMEFSLSGDYRNLDIAPQEQIFITLNSEDTIRGIIWDRKPFIVQQMNGVYSPQQQNLMWSASMHELTKGIPGTMIEIPDVPPDYWPDYTYPPINIPGFPPITFPPMPTDELKKAYVMGWAALGQWVIARTDNFDASSPTWANRKPVNITGSAPGILKVDPWDSDRCAYYADNGALYYLTDLNTVSPTATILRTTTQMLASIQTLPGCSTASGPRIQNMAVSSPKAGKVALLVLVALSVSPFWAICVAYRNTYGGSFNYTKLNGHSDSSIGNFYPRVGMDMGKYDENLIYVGTCNGAETQEQLERSLDGGATFSVIYSITGTAGTMHPNSVHIPSDPSSHEQGVWMMGGYAKTGAYIRKSADQGATWQDRTYFGVHGTYEDGGGARYRTVELKSFLGNYQDIIAIVKRSALDSGYEAGHIISSKDNGIHWTLQKTFLNSVQQATQSVRFLERHPYNSDRIYCVGNATDGYILASANRGSTWTSKLGNWFAAFGAYPTIDAGGNFCTFHPIW